MRPVAVERPVPWEIALLATTRILIIDDEPVLRELLSELLQDEQATTIALETADAGMMFLEENPGSVDLVITDVRMPGVLTGFDLANKVRERWPHLPVIITSGYHDLKKQRKPDNSTLLPKPWVLSELLDMIDACLISRSA